MQPDLNFSYARSGADETGLRNLYAKQLRKCDSRKRLYRAATSSRIAERWSVNQTQVTRVKRRSLSTLTSLCKMGGSSMTLKAFRMGCLASRRIVLGIAASLCLLSGSALSDNLMPPPNTVPASAQTQSQAPSAGGSTFFSAPSASTKPAFVIVPAGSQGGLQTRARGAGAGAAAAGAAAADLDTLEDGEGRAHRRATVLAQPLAQPPAQAPLQPPAQAPLQPPALAPAQPQAQGQLQQSQSAPKTSVQDIATRTAIEAANRAAALTDPAITRMDTLQVADWIAQPTQVLFSTYGGLVTASGKSVDVPILQQPELLQEFTCNHVLSKSFTRTQRTVTVLVYTFPDARGAFGAYSSMRKGSSNVILRGDASSEDENSVSFWRGQRFVVLTTSADDDDTSKHLISKLADELSRTIDDSFPKPRLVMTLPQLDRIAGTERFFMGPIGARKHISIPFMQMLSIDKSNGAAFAEYQFPHPLPERMKALLIDYRDAQTARSVYEGYSAALAASHKTQLTQPNMQISKLGETYMLCGINGRRITIISGARRKVSPLVLARQFAY